MPSKAPMNDDPQNMWQNQPTEAFKMSADELRRKVQRREKKARFEALFSITIGLVLFVFFGVGAFVGNRELFARMGFGLLGLWSIYFAYQAYKWIWPGRLTADTTLNTTLESYRSELEKRRDYGRHIWRRAGLTVCFLGLAVLVLPELIKSLNDPRRLLNVAPVLVLFAIWLAIFIPTRKRQQRKLQHEIDELRVFEADNRS